MKAEEGAGSDRQYRLDVRVVLVAWSEGDDGLEMTICERVLWDTAPSQHRHDIITYMFKQLTVGRVLSPHMWSLIRKLPNRNSLATLKHKCMATVSFHQQRCGVNTGLLYCCIVADTYAYLGAGQELGSSSCFVGFCVSCGSLLARLPRCIVDTT